MTAWAQLNARQPHYLQAISAVDQENEPDARGTWTRGARPGRAAQWRWMVYGIFPETGDDSPLRPRLRAAQLLDPGVGSTFEALEKRGSLHCRSEGDLADPFV